MCVKSDIKPKIQSARDLGKDTRTFTDEDTSCKVSQAQDGYLSDLPLGGFNLVIICMRFGVKRL